MKLTCSSEETRCGDLLDALVRLARERIGNPRLAPAVVQLGALAAIEAAEGDGNGEEPAVTWLYRVVRRALQEISASAGSTRNDYDAAFAPADPLAVEAEQRFIGACLRQLIPLLGDDGAELIERIDLGGESLPAVARQLGLPAADATVLVYRARAELRRRFADACAGSAQPAECYGAG